MAHTHAHEQADPAIQEPQPERCPPCGSNDATAPTFHRGRSYKVSGMDCAEEVAVLKEAVAPIVGGADRLAFDVLNGRMTIADLAGNVPPDRILKAVAATGMTAAPWQPEVSS